MLAEDADLGDEWREDDDCGCWVTNTVVDGVTVDLHHWLPDDAAPHVPDLECGCGPQLIGNPDGVLLYEHNDQDDQDMYGRPGEEMDTPARSYPARAGARRTA